MGNVVAEASRTSAASGAGGTQETQAPARVNLLGEHTDYTGGLVLPLAIPFYTTAEMSVGAEGYTFTSSGFGGERVVAEGEDPAPAKQWSDYPVGVLRELEHRGHAFKPFRLKLGGNVPLGAGLSSSASVEVASCLAMLRQEGKTMEAAEVALLCQKVENEFVGSPCGIMDQFVIVAAEKEHALLIHTRDLHYELVPLNRGNMHETCLVVFNSNVKHSIADGDYGDRRKEVEAGQTAMQNRYHGLTDLGAATMDQLLAAKSDMPEKAFMRCRHIISENARVREARAVLMEGAAADAAERLGALLVKAHASQRDDFECSSVEMDFLVNAALTIDGCYGARMTGGGFGGCTVNLVRREKAEGFAVALKEAYKTGMGLDGEFYRCEAVDGAMKLNGLA